jgi:hypothetical protein
MTRTLGNDTSTPMASAFRFGSRFFVRRNGFSRNAQYAR